MKPSLLLRPHYIVTTFVGSALLFMVQPLVARMLLSATGAVPALWNTCMVFFQFTLLVGYLYAHVVPARLGLRLHGVLHVVFMVYAVSCQPLDLRNEVAPEGDPTAWLLLTLVRTVFPVVLPLAGAASLLQWWHTRVWPERDLRPLFTASNAGSLAALLAAPLVLDVYLTLSTQCLLFVKLYVTWVVLTCMSLLIAWRTHDASKRRTQDVPENDAPYGVTRWLRHVALAAVPSSLMLGVTAHLATDVGSMPLLWVLPLALYLGAFIVAFARVPRIPDVRVIAPLVSLLVLMFLFTAPQIATRWPLVFAHLALFSACAWVLLGTLARERPPAAQVTAFQLAIAVGGVLGGVFNTFVAPRVFVRVSEYPLAMALVLLLLPKAPSPPDRRPKHEALLRDAGLDPDAVLGARPVPHIDRVKPLFDVLVPIAVGALAVTLFAIPVSTRAPSLMRYGLPLMVLVFLSIRRRTRLALGLMAIVFAARADRAVVHASRTFYGTLRVEDVRGVRRFMHGTTLHGLQYLAAKHRDAPTAYYAPESPIARAIAALDLRRASVGVVGLGVGMLVAHATAGQQWTFYELDPAVVVIAQRYFTWLRHARVPVRTVLGDARRTLARDINARHRLLVLDAFSSDAIPTHLLTCEAVRLYLSRLDAHGVLAFHVTNRHADLVPVLSVVARDTGLRARVMRGSVWGPDGAVMTTWVLMARREGDLGAVVSDARWAPLAPAPSVMAWTDERANVLGALRWW
jgi:hypothetical protein